MHEEKANNSVACWGWYAKEGKKGGEEVELDEEEEVKKDQEGQEEEW